MGESGVDWGRGGWGFVLDLSPKRPPKCLMSEGLGGCFFGWGVGGLGRWGRNCKFKLTHKQFPFILVLRV